MGRFIKVDSPFTDTTLPYVMDIDADILARPSLKSWLNASSYDADSGAFLDKKDGATYTAIGGKTIGVTVAEDAINGRDVLHFDSTPVNDCGLLYPSAGLDPEVPLSMFFVGRVYTAAFNNSIFHTGNSTNGTQVYCSNTGGNLNYGASAVSQIGGRDFKQTFACLLVRDRANSLVRIRLSDNWDAEFSRATSSDTGTNIVWGQGTSTGETIMDLAEGIVFNEDVTLDARMFETLKRLAARYGV